MMARALLIAFCALLLAPAAKAQDAGWDALAAPDSRAFMRHALAPGTGDPANFTLGDCSTQRNLDERGREQARAAGALLRERGITFDKVYTSEWCRCRETAELMDVGPVEPLPALNSFFRQRSQREPQTQELAAFIAAAPQNQRLLFVTHMVNVRAITGRNTTSGEVVVAVSEPGAGAEGALNVVGTIRFPVP